MRNRRVIAGILVVFLAIALFLSCAKTGQKVQYQLKFEEGKKYHIRMVSEQKSEQTMMGQLQNIEQTTEFGYDFDVNEVDEDGKAWVKYTCQLVKIRQKGPMGQIEYDSAKKDATVPPAAQGLVVLLGEGFSVKMTPEGRVVEIKGLEEMRRSIEKKIPDGGMKEQMIEGLKQQFSEQAVKELTENTMAIYPERPVGIGDSWSKRVVTSHGQATITENKWTLKKRENGVAFIELGSTIKPNPEAKPMEMGQMKIEHEIEGKQSGLIKMQESTGLIIHSKINQQISGQMKIEGAGEGMGEMTMPMKTENVITFEMTERK